PSLDREWLRWVSRFIGSANSRHALSSQEPLRDISLLSKSLYELLDAQLHLGMHHQGVMLLSKTERSAEKQRQQAVVARELGLDVVSLSQEEAVQAQGGLPMNVAGAVHYRCDAHLDPALLMAKLID